MLCLSIVVAGAAACGGDDPAQSSGGLPGALDSISAGEASEQRFAWSDVAAIRELADLPASADELDYAALRPWGYALGTGAPQLVTAIKPLAEELRLDLLAADRAMTIGIPRKAAVRLDGVDGAAVEDALRETGGQESDVGDHVAVTRERGGSDDGSDGPDFLSPALLAFGNRGVADGQTVVFSGDDATMLEALGEGGDPLGDQAAYAAAAECLDDVVSAELYGASLARAPGVEVLAIGIRRDEAPVEVLCAVGDEDDAKRSADTLRERMDPGATTPDTRQHLGDIVRDVEVDTGNAGDRSYARAVLTLNQDDDRPRGFLQQAFAQGALRSYLGG